MKSSLGGGLVALPNCLASAFGAEPLTAWNGTAPKQAILAFIERVTKGDCVSLFGFLFFDSLQASTRSSS